MEENKGKKVQKKPKFRITAQDIALVGVMAAVIVVSKEAMSFLPNIEPVSFWIIMFTLAFGWRVLFVVPVFILIEGLLYGMNLWWAMYLLAWPLLALLAYLFRRQTSVMFWCILSGAFGLSFGLLCAVPYAVVGAVGRGVRAGLHAGFAWWIAGIPWDITHCAGNFAIMLVLYYPMGKVMKILNRSLNLPPRCS